MRAALFRYFGLLGVGAILAAHPVLAQTYQYSNPDGSIGYSDNPYEAQIKEDHAPPVSPIDMRGEPVDEGEDAAAPAAPTTPKKPEGIVPVGDPTYGYTMQGLAAVAVTVRNDLENAVTDIAVRIALLDGAKEPLDIITLRGPTGVKGRTEPGGTLTLNGVANTPPDLIADQEVTTSWSNLQKNAPPPVATPEPTPTTIPTPTLTKEDLPTSRTQQKRLLKQKYLEQKKQAEGETP